MGDRLGIPGAVGFFSLLPSLLPREASKDKQEQRLPAPWNALCVSLFTKEWGMDLGLFLGDCPGSGLRACDWKWPPSSLGWQAGPLDHSGQGRSELLSSCVLVGWLAGLLACLF